MKRAYLIVNDASRKPYAIDYCANNWILIVGFSDRISGHEVKSLDSNPDMLLIDEGLVDDLSVDFRRKLIRKNENTSIHVINGNDLQGCLEVVPLQRVPDGDFAAKRYEKRVSTVLSVSSDRQGHLFTAYLAALVKSNFVNSNVSLSELGCAFQELSFFPSASSDTCNDLSDLLKVIAELNTEKLQKACRRVNDLDLYICPYKDGLDQAFYRSIVDALKDNYDFSFIYLTIRNGFQYPSWFIDRSDLVFIVSDCSPGSYYFLRQNMEELKSLVESTSTQLILSGCDHPAAFPKRIFRNLTADFKTMFLPCDDGISLLYEQTGRILLNRTDLSFVGQVASLARNFIA